MHRRHHDHRLSRFHDLPHRHDFGGPGLGAGMGRLGRGRGGWARRAPRGNVRTAILLLLHERPMHGYEIITELGERTQGLWQPSSGSIYPTLSLLEDEGLVTSNEESGRRRFTLTDSGMAQVVARGEVPAPWEEILASAGPSASGLRESGALLFAALGQVARAGTAQQVAQTVALIDETRRRLYKLLAETGDR